MNQGLKIRKVWAGPPIMVARGPDTADKIVVAQGPIVEDRDVVPQGPDAVVTSWRWVVCHRCFAIAAVIAMSFAVATPLATLLNDTIQRHQCNLAQPRWLCLFKTKTI